MNSSVFELDEPVKPIIIPIIHKPAPIYNYSYKQKPKPLNINPTSRFLEESPKQRRNKELIEV